MRQRGSHAQRVADGQHPIADLQPVGVGQLHSRQVLRLNLEQGDIDQRIKADDLGPISAAIREGDLDGVGIGDDVVIAQDVAVGTDDRTRAHAAKIFVGNFRVEGGQ